MQERRRPGRKLHRQAGGTAEKSGGTVAARPDLAANRQDCGDTKSVDDIIKQAATANIANYHF
jgi:hypothetical protein